LVEPLNLLLALQQPVFSFFQLGNVQKGNDDPVNLVVYRAIRQQPGQIPFISFTADFPFNLDQRSQHLGGIVYQVVEAQPAAQVGQRLSFVRRQDIQQFSDFGGKSLNVELAIQK
jgi:hypothetical protein